MGVLAATSDAGRAYHTISKVSSFILREIGIAKKPMMNSVRYLMSLLSRFQMLRIRIRLTSKTEN
jgi:hypothetical protein